MALRNEIIKALSWPYKSLIATLPSRLLRGLAARRITGGARYVLIACMPKSGSTLLSNLIGSLGGFKVGSMVPEYGRREQELDERCLIDSTYIFRTTVFQHHVRCNEWTQKLIESYPFHVIVLCRRLADVVVSVSDHFDNESIVGSMAYVTKEQLTCLDRRGVRLEFIVNVIIPWYINFYASWVRYARQGGRVQFVYYEDFIDEKIGVVESVLRRAGLAKDGMNEELAGVLEGGVRSRLNKGIVGRGEALLSENPELGERISELVSYYPDVDFSPVLGFQ